MRKFVISVLSLILVFANSAAQEQGQSKVEVPVERLFDNQIEGGEITVT